MPTLSTQEIIIRLLVAFVLSAIIGIEREYYRKPAGLRTLVIVGLGAALFTLISAQVRGLFPGALSDPGRIASQIVVGIGFIGAGTIIRSRGAIVGLTTAATIFVVAAIGVAVGFGLYTEAVAVTILVLITFYGLSYLVKYLRERSRVPPQLRDEDEDEEESKGIVMH